MHPPRFSNFASAASFVAFLHSLVIKILICMGLPVKDYHPKRLLRRMPAEIFQSPELRSEH
eukprot:6460961-Amphidinium_carterae.2